MRPFVFSRPSRVLNVVLKRPSKPITLPHTTFSNSFSTSVGLEPVTLEGTPTDSSWLYASHHPLSSPELLLRLVTEKRYGAAERVLLSIEDAGRTNEIPPHPAYEHAALAALQWDDENLRWLQFTTWFNLIPHINHPNSVVSEAKKVVGTGYYVSRRPLGRTLDMLFRAGKPTSNLPLIKQFTLICASKGYSRYVYSWVLPFLADQPISSVELVNFIVQTEKVAVEYEASHSLRSWSALASFLRARAVYHLCHAGRHAAVQKILVRNASDGNIVLSDNTYIFAINAIEKLKTDGLAGRRLSQRVKALKALREVEMAKRHSLGWRPRKQVDLKLVELPGPGSNASDNRVRNRKDSPSEVAKYHALYDLEGYSIT